MFAASALAREAPDADLQKARAHFKVGEAFFRSGAYEKAIDEYQAAYALAPRPGLLFNLGAAHRKKAEATGSIEDKKQALDYYRKYLDADPGGKASADAKDYIATLTKEIAGAEAAAAAPEPASQPVEPPPVPKPTPVAASPPAPARPPPAARPVEADRPARGAPLRVAGIATAGAGVALVTAGVYFGLRSKSIFHEVDGLSDHWDQALYDSGKAAQRNAYLLAGGGVAAIAGGGVMYFVLGRRNERRAVSVRPSMTRSTATVVVSGRF